MRAQVSLELVLQLIAFHVHDASWKGVCALMHGCAGDDVRVSFSVVSLSFSLSAFIGLASTRSEQTASPCV